MSYTEDNKVKFHSRLRIVAATCTPVERRANESLVLYRPQAEKRQEALFAEAPRWQSQSTVQELSKWLLDETGLFWPASWACVRVADVLSVVEAEGELVEQRTALLNLRTQLSQLCTLSASLDTQLMKAAETLENVEHLHELASIEARHYDGTKLDGTQCDRSPTTVLVTATEKLRAEEEERARNQRARLQHDRESAQMSAAEVEKEIAQREQRIRVLEDGLATCAISDSLELDWEKTLMECHADEKPTSLTDRWAQEEREAEEEGQNPDTESHDAHNFNSYETDDSDSETAEVDQDERVALADAKSLHKSDTSISRRSRKNRKVDRRKTTEKVANRGTAADILRGEGGLLGEALALRATRLDARLPALQRHTELLPLPISTRHVHQSKPPFGSPGGDQPRPRRLSASPSRLLTPLRTPDKVSDGALAPLANDQPVRRHLMISSPLFGR